MALSRDHVEVVKQMPKDLSPYDQILWLLKRSVDFTAAGWGTPTERQQMAIQKGPIAVEEIKLEGGRVQR